MRINLETAEVERARRATMWVLDMEPQPLQINEHCWQVGKEIVSDPVEALLEHLEHNCAPCGLGDTLEFYGPLGIEITSRTVESVTAKRLGELTEEDAKQCGFRPSFGMIESEKRSIPALHAMMTSGRARQPERFVWCVTIERT